MIEWEPFITFTETIMSITDSVTKFLTDYINDLKQMFQEILGLKKPTTQPQAWQKPQQQLQQQPVQTQQQEPQQVSQQQPQPATQNIPTPEPRIMTPEPVPQQPVQQPTPPSDLSHDTPINEQTPSNTHAGTPVPN